MSRDECEQVIGKLFYDGLLSLEMGYTAYSTNAYLKLSPQGSRLLQGLHADRPSFIPVDCTDEDLSGRGQVTMTSG